MDPVTTIVSTKGQVILPKAIREHRDWQPGTRLIVEETAAGILLRPAPHVAETAPDQVFASLPYQGAPKSIAAMDEGILAEAKRRHGRG